MKLIIGGRNQGKTEFVRELAAELSSDKEKDPDKKGGNDSPSAISEADGRTSSFEAAMKAGVILHLECYIRRLMEAGKDPYLFAARLQEENPEALITADEIGCGIVPIDAFLREYRETDGRICQKLASFSEEVYRVMCGIGIRIK